MLTVLYMIKHRGISIMIGRLCDLLIWVTLNNCILQLDLSGQEVKKKKMK